MDQVVFKIGTSDQYKALEEKNPNAIYWLKDTQQVYIGETLYATGAIASETTDGLMSSADKQAIESAVKSSSQLYEFSDLLDGCRSDITGKELRVMFPADSTFVAEEDNKAYFSIKFYAPSDRCVKYRQAIGQTIPEETEKEVLTEVDSYGRKYFTHKFACAKLDEETGSWIYYGAESVNENLRGYYYTIEWYDEEDTCINSTTIRINLTNEKCHNSLVENALIWGTMGE